MPKNIKAARATVASLLKSELKTEKLATVNEDKTRKMAGNIALERIVAIAKSRNMTGALPAKVKQVLGTCLSCGVTVDGKDPRELIREMNEGRIKVE